VVVSDLRVCLLLLSSGSARCLDVHLAAVALRSRPWNSWASHPRVAGPWKARLVVSDGWCFGPQREGAGNSVGGTLGTVALVAQALPTRTVVVFVG